MPPVDMRFAMILTQDSTQSKSWTWLVTVLIMIALLTPWPIDAAQASAWDQLEVVADEDDGDRDRDHDPPPALVLSSLTAAVSLSNPADHREPLSAFSFLVWHVCCPRPPPLAFSRSI